MRSVRRTIPLLLALAVSATATPAPAAAFKGPPWISIEMPANPFDHASRGAFLLVHAFHHGTELGLPVTGRAEGIVNGQRRTVKLRFEATSRPGVYALQNLWGTEGTWTLVITAAQGPGDGATALVELSADGRVAVSVPSRQERDWTIPRAVTDAEVETALRARAAAVVGTRGR
jgi:hypothetical protein